MRIKKLLMTMAVGFTAWSATAQTPMWNDPGKNADNRMTSVADFFAYENQELAVKGGRRCAALLLSLQVFSQRFVVPAVDERGEPLLGGSVVEAGDFLKQGRAVVRCQLEVGQQTVVRAAVGCHPAQEPLWIHPVEL